MSYGFSSQYQWFRILALALVSVFSGLNALGIIMGLPGYLVIAYFTWLFREDNLKWVDEHIISEDKAHESYQLTQGREMQKKWRQYKKRLHRWAPVAWGIGLLTFFFTIPGAEIIIKHNYLSPHSDLSQTGQLIPLAIGAIVFVDGCFGLLRWYRLKDKSTEQPVRRE
jgi:hypothetical protein